MQGIIHNAPGVITGKVSTKGSALVGRITLPPSGGAEKVLQGVPPLTFSAKAGALINYRIYGNTLNGESVGDRTGNLFGYTVHAGTTSGYLLYDGQIRANGTWGITDYIPCNGTDFTLSSVGGNDPSICLYDENRNFIIGQNYSTGSVPQKQAVTISSSQQASYIRFSYKKEGEDSQIDDISKIMLNPGSDAMSFEPYGYRVPVSVNSTATNIYLPYQLRKVKNDYEYIDYTNQKMYRLHKNLLKPVGNASGHPDGVTYNIADGVITLSGTANRTTMLVRSVFPRSFAMPTCLDSGGTGVLHFCNSAASDVVIKFLDYYANELFSITLDEETKIVTTYPAMNNVYWLAIHITSGTTYDLVISPMLCDGITAVTEFEEYFPEEESVVDVTLPEISVTAGTNTLSVGTTVQPSSVEIRYR